MRSFLCDLCGKSCRGFLQSSVLGNGKRICADCTDKGETVGVGGMISYQQLREFEFGMDKKELRKAWKDGHIRDFKDLTRYCESKGLRPIGKGAPMPDAGKIMRENVRAREEANEKAARRWVQENK